MSESVYVNDIVEAEKANYKTFPIDEYNNNPLIQALPEIADSQLIVRKMAMYPSIKDEEKQLDSNIRLHLIHRLYKLFQPMPIHQDIWHMITSLMMQGYLARNPFSSRYKRYLNQSGRQIINRTYGVENVPEYRSTASCAIIIGVSGMGKTTSANRVLTNIPQLIVHNEFEGKSFDQVQVTHLTLQAPHNSSLKSLCLQFFMKVDDLLGTNNYKTYLSRSLSVDAMIPLMGRIAQQQISLGLLVIDELQHLQGKNVKQVMSFFVTLMNSFGVPILLISTNAGYSIFQNELRIARRVSGNGEVIWNNMSNDKEFRFFIESIWKYQWTKQFTPLTTEMVDVFYEETQGISDLVLKLFINGQQKAVESKKEVMDISLIRKTADDNFKLMKPMISAISSGNPYKIEAYEDIRRIESYGIDDGFDSHKEKEKRKETSQTIRTKKRNKVVTSFLKDDLRFIDENEKKLSPYEHLCNKGVIEEDMSKWMETEGND